MKETKIYTIGYFYILFSIIERPDRKKINKDIYRGIANKNIA